MQADTIVGPHAVVVHQQDALVTNTAVMCAERLYELALGAEGIFAFRKLSHGVLKRLKVIFSDR